MDIKKTLRFTCIGVLVIIIISTIIGTIRSKNNPPKDLNVYLNEEVCFADNIFIKAVGIAAYKNEENIGIMDLDGDELSEYVLKVNIEVVRRSEKEKESEIQIEPSMFSLKSVNLKAKSKMSVFIESVFHATISMAVSGSIEGDISLLEETIGFAEDYITSSIENAETSKAKFKPIKLNNETFEPFVLANQSEIHYLSLVFPIKKEYLESENVITLAIDTWHNWEKRIFLIVRPIDI